MSGACIEGPLYEIYHVASPPYWFTAVCAGCGAALIIFVMFFFEKSRYDDYLCDCSKRFYYILLILVNLMLSCYALVGTIKYIEEMKTLGYSDWKSFLFLGACHANGYQIYLTKICTLIASPVLLDENSARGGKGLRTGIPAWLCLLTILPSIVLEFVMLICLVIPAMLAYIWITIMAAIALYIVILFLMWITHEKDKYLPLVAFVVGGILITFQQVCTNYSLLLYSGDITYIHVVAAEAESRSSECFQAAMEGDIFAVPLVINDDMLSPLECLNNGILVGSEENGTFSCDCTDTNAWGTICENLCLNDGVASDDACVCSPQFVGDTCAEAVQDACSSQPCVNGGICVLASLPDNVINSTSPGCENCTNTSDSGCEDCVITYGSSSSYMSEFECDCTETAYTGDLCEEDFACLYHGCSNNGECVYDGSNFVCDCDGTNAFGLYCDNFCENNGILVDAGDACDCNGTGYTGPLCTRDVDDCESNPCEEGMLCVDAGVYEYICSDADDCSSNPCPDGEICFDVGVLSFNCTDIDDCLSAPCFVGACVDTGLNSFTCNCEGTNAIGASCDQLCLNGGNNPTGSNTECSCHGNYTGSLCELEAVNPCQSSPCENYGLCENLGVNNEFICHCNTDYTYYTFEGDLCEDTPFDIYIIPIIALVICVASIVLFVWLLTEKWTKRPPGVLFDIVFCMGDLVSDIFYVATNPFASSTLFVAAVIALLAPLTPALVYVFYTEPPSLENLLGAIDALNAFMLEQMAFLGDKWANFRKLVNGRLHFFLFYIVAGIFYVIILVIVFIMAVAIIPVMQLILWILLLAGGTLAFSAKAFVFPSISDPWLKLWHGEHEVSKTPDEIDVKLYNSILMIEFIFESVPQLIIQAVNNEELNDWSTIGWVSVAFTAFQLCRIGFHFFSFMVFPWQMSFDEVPMMGNGMTEEQMASQEIEEAKRASQRRANKERKKAEKKKQKEEKSKQKEVVKGKDIELIIHDEA